MFNQVDRVNARIMTDEHMIYRNVSKLLPHDVIRHKSEYVRGEAHTQGIESFWALLKRGLVGTYHQVDAGSFGETGRFRGFGVVTAFLTAFLKRHVELDRLVVLGWVFLRSHRASCL